ncbi:hypothetical protein E8E12_004924 [Didymella heteroderae]|uniref:CoA-binding domain-containing protein n=1 Tax=Didymella heteroderae TaxID=1769908 RepID=A0A9P5BZM5_9PLEO|nr:hypothetical protein E8E12_004924 [Didymella heteroderae]
MPVTRGQKRDADMEAALKTFFSSPRFAVAGASSDPSKFGHRVFAWYLQHSLPATPINPRSPTISVLKRDHTTIPSPSALSDPPASQYSLSVITPPAITKQLLKEAKEAGVPAVWLQPGSFNDDVLQYAQQNFKAAIAGDGGRGDFQWTPFAIRWYFMIIPTSLSVVLALLVVVSHWLSEKHDGITSEGSAMMGWRFVPTLTAVIYTQLAAMVLGALKRTEPFARLARPIGQVPVARYTLLEKSKPWWTTFAHGFQKKRNPGSWSWAVILSSFAFILAILGISPLSSALLSTKDIQVRTPTNLSRLVLNNTPAVRARSERATYLRTTGALLQNYSTSPWVTDDYFILPFWPKELQQTRWTFETQTPQTWEAETTVFHNDFVCTVLETKQKDLYLRHTVEDFEVDMYKKTYLASVLLESTNDCRLNLTYNATSNPEINQSSVDFRRYESFASWTDIRKMAWHNEFDRDSRIILNDECQMNEMILMSTPWMTLKVKDALLPNTTITAYACRSEHTMANMSVRVLSTSSGLTIDFDKERFSQIRAPVSAEVLNLTSFHELYSNPEWFEYLPQPFLLDKYITGGNPPPLHGAAALLGTKYGFNITTMMAADDLPQEAAKMRRL